MRTQLIKSESSLFTSFRRTMYALMIIVITLAIPVLSYLELSYNSSIDSDEKKSIEIENIASSTVKENTVQL